MACSWGGVRRPARSCRPRCSGPPTRTLCRTSAWPTSTAIEVTVNGYPCKPPASAGDEFLFSSRLTKAGDVTSNPNGSNVTELNVAEWPGVNTLGVSMNRVDFALLLGIIDSRDSGNRYYSKVVRAGETFVIPRGLMHFQYNVGKEEATMVVSFNSQNPGIVFVPLTLFGSNPPIPTPVLAKALRVDDGVVELLKSKFTGGY
ncbi:hypothetical protein GUJ93_ZPchr0014g47204 [Zizania palustris]|uniref:Cupin type-1 domain-containing protein n=1 Tax=Zizania palustris TaxID=103762 RepID=A0A8J5THG2_ZIZPA|nr:hypothetical protein GUJ93_ZPchr0014g47204 [Zizania palustris]